MTSSMWIPFLQKNMFSTHDLWLSLKCYRIVEYFKNHFLLKLFFLFVPFQNGTIVVRNFWNTRPLGCKSPTNPQSERKSLAVDRAFSDNYIRLWFSHGSVILLIFSSLIYNLLEKVSYECFPLGFEHYRFHFGLLSIEWHSYDECDQYYVNIFWFFNFYPIS